MSTIHDLSHPLFPNGFTWAVISISDDETFPDIHRTEQCKGILQLNFNDIEKPQFGKILFDKKHAKSILEFAKKQVDDNLDYLIVHCYAGQCRSPAICAALSKIYGLKEQWLFDHFYPNMRVYKTILETYYTG